MDCLNVLMIDPNTLFREGLRRLLTGDQFQVTAEARDVCGGIDIVAAGTVPDLVLADIPVEADEATLDMLRRLHAMAPDARIVVLTDEVSTTVLSRVLEAGADGYLLKDLSAEALIQSLRLVMMGEKVFPTPLADLLISGRLHGAPRQQASMSQLNHLSSREVEILRCLLSGDSNKIIARHLRITEATVKVHLKSLLRKINANNRTQAAIWALTHGIDGRHEDTSLAVA